MSGLRAAAERGRMKLEEERHKVCRGQPGEVA